MRRALLPIVAGLLLGRILLSDAPAPARPPAPGPAATRREPEGAPPAADAAEYGRRQRAYLARAAELVPVWTAEGRTPGELRLLRAELKASILGD